MRGKYGCRTADGTLYVVDLYRGIIQHRAYITEYLRDQIAARTLEQPTGLGRIYRVVHETMSRDTGLARATATPLQLVEGLSHPNGWWRDAAQRLLIERDVESVVPALVNLAESAKDWRTRLHALWTLDGLDAIGPAIVTKALEDPSRDVRSSALRIAERWLGEPRHPISAVVMKRLDDTDWSVRQQLAASIGALPLGPRESAAVALLERHADDPIVMDAALSGLRGSEAVVLETLLQGDGRHTSPRDAAITMIAATIVRGAQDAAIQKLMGSMAQRSSARWQRSALLRGAEIALLGAAMPGTPAPRVNPSSTTGSAPCPTCPGGRAGPGGAYAFPRPPDWPSTPGSSAATRAAGPRLRLNREPEPLSLLADSGDELSRRAMSLLTRIEWPGKPGAVAVPPLRREEQQRFAAGQEVYRNICQACHQSDGRGQHRLAPSLIGSTFALAVPEIPARVLLNGKEGPVGLMPPIGATLNDEQLASVLTYIRREWGQAGTPVDPATVKAVRTLTAGRTRPWTDAELVALVGAGRGGLPQ